jgi:hypothetical protein
MVINKYSFHEESNEINYKTPNSWSIKLVALFPALVAAPHQSVYVLLEALSLKLSRMKCTSASPDWQASKLAQKASKQDSHDHQELLQLLRLSWYWQGPRVTSLKLHLIQIKLKLQLDVHCLLLSSTHDTMDGSYDLLVHNSTMTGSLTEAEAHMAASTEGPGCLWIPVLW